ncbi:peptidase family M12A-domain-containing protein [Jimgerdemannia flammicorona]|uniref:Metalloendopeptidase n=1 Tax=Jimgerdemannia flammicorona TaxID=994334 RepID=A0A433QHB2_9FUNG|nr:peptidase family M12A-domain-containing protein [Jimgerdemannia flammicorona]
MRSLSRHFLPFVLVTCALLQVVFSKTTTHDTSPGNHNYTVKSTCIWDYDKRNVTYYTTADNKVVIDGDVIYGTPTAFQSAERRCSERHLSKRQTALERRSVTVQKSLTWPSKTIIYKIDPAYTGLTPIVNAAIAAWKAKTCGKLIFKLAAAGQTNYVLVTGYPGCYTDLGWGPGVRTFNLGPGCDIPWAMHLLGHTIGLHHEHQRSDRDKYIDIVISPIPYELAELPVGEFHNSVAYDFCSIMHFPFDAYSPIPGKPSMVSRVPPLQVPQKFPSVISPLDADDVRELYDLACDNPRLCIPYPGQNKCDPTTSCTSTDLGFMCACRPGYKATTQTNNDLQWRQLWSVPGHEHRVFVKPGTVCNTLCDKLYVDPIDVCSDVTLVNQCFP